MTPTRRILVLGAVLAFGAAACGDTTPAEPRESAEPASTTATIVGDDLAFDTTQLETAIGQTLSMTFDNREAGIAHNLHVEGTATGDATTDIEEGPTTQTLAVSFDEAGEFEYFCDVHPQQMRGTITVTS
jgi:plastocyanin